MSSPLTGKVAIVTGASRGIGAGIAERFAADGATVVVNYNSSKSAADALVDKINREGPGKAVAVKADMSLLEEAVQLVEDTVKQHGRLDVLVLNAAIVIDGTLDAVTPAQFDASFLLNVKVPLFMAQAAARHMQAGGRIIFFSSGQARVSSVRPLFLLYTASKGAVEQTTRVLAKDLGARGVTVNTLAPGATDTDMFRTNAARYPGVDLAAQVAAMHPPGRIGRVDDIAPVAAFLAREEAGWINGQVIQVSGGYVV
ncbi:hypothetical protein PHLGIDRAFT_222147 [Phlebiopsis gigantea 11061_1 CR5-6]|uniref:Uncharacterized protein n=1 Tax=Phlebiopsis gigantea (strain 11061_1 CR5-6) TaxID=745531 RepID=A0A0C3S624_PHLG1|nr:hypothetical protein PHLGIDRAFT_222147 [Phlebiopsis gigantea 11061_1 CR5-6]